MSVRKLKPITPGQRFRIVNEYSEVTTSKPEKSLLKPMKKSGGRNNQGRMTCLLYTSPSPRDRQKSRMPSSA